LEIIDLPVGWSIDSQSELTAQDVAPRSDGYVNASMMIPATTTPDAYTLNYRVRNIGNNASSTGQQIIIVKPRPQIISIEPIELRRGSSTVVQTNYINEEDSVNYSLDFNGPDWFYFGGTIDYDGKINITIPTQLDDTNSDCGDPCVSRPVPAGNYNVALSAFNGYSDPYSVGIDLQSLAKDITAFSFATPSVTGVITGTAISVILPLGTSKTALVPTITLSGGTISPLSGVAQDFTNPVTYTVTAEDASTQAYIVTVRVLSATQTVPDGDGNASISSTTPQVLITNPNQPVTIRITGVVANPSIDVSAFITNGTGTLPEIIVYSQAADIAIQGGTAIISDDSGWSGSWSGIISAPTVTTVSLPPTSGQTKTVTAAIKIGYSGARLSFDKAVRILIPNQAGKRAGYMRDGVPFTEITSTCADDSTDAGNALSPGGECKKDVGAHLVIWTKHFTSFVAYT